jgi:hypothetical protein
MTFDECREWLQQRYANPAQGSDAAASDAAEGEQSAASAEAAADSPRQQESSGRSLPLLPPGFGPDVPRLAAASERQQQEDRSSGSGYHMQQPFEELWAQEHSSRRFEPVPFPGWAPDQLPNLPSLLPFWVPSWGGRHSTQPQHPYPGLWVTPGWSPNDRGGWQHPPYQQHAAAAAADYACGYEGRGAGWGPPSPRRHELDGQHPRWAPYERRHRRGSGWSQ